LTRLYIILLLLAGFALRAAPDTLLLSTFSGRQAVKDFAGYARYSQDRNFSYLIFEDKKPGPTNRDSALFINFFIKNDLPQPQKLFIQLNGNEYWEFVDKDEQGKAKLTHAGYLENHSLLDIKEDKFAFDLTVKSGTVFNVMLKTYNISTRPSSVNHVSLLNEVEYLRGKVSDDKELLPGFAISVFFQGGVWLMMLYMFLLYFQNNRDRTYLFYGLYMLFSMYYLLQKIAGDGPFFFVFGDNAIVRHLLNEPIQWLIYIAYNLFVMYFLEIKKHAPKLYRAFKVINVAYLGYMMAELSFMLLTFDKVTQGQLFIYSKLVVVIVSIFIIVEVIRKVRTPLVPYVVVGSMLFMLFSVTAMLYSIGLKWLPETQLYPINFMHIGIMLEVLCFSLGLGKRIFMVAREKEKLQKAYIDQLIRNEEIIQLNNQELSVQVNERTSEILDKTRELEREREEKLMARYEKQLTESEMSALRLQMNPHFIFNALNSIRYYILKEDSEKASDYITSFSKLLRMILQHSKQTSVKLSEELEALNLYLDFERQRFEEKFEFTINVGDDIQPQTMNIQPMIIQPFLENSIWHGLMHMDDPGHLLVDISLYNHNTLKVVIEDNGIGRENSKKIKAEQQSHTYKSMGMQITRDRLKLMEKLQHGETGYEVEDLLDDKGNSKGTRVIIKIRLK
jgi:sensor histidine kinase YesM